MATVVSVSERVRMSETVALRTPQLQLNWSWVGWTLVCLLVMASRVVPDEPLIVGANRDELMERPATPITVLAPSGPRVLGGRDEQSGGTWLAVNEHGVCAGLTNQPLGDAKDPSKRSRGDLPLALARHASAAAAVEALVAGLPARGLQRLLAAGRATGPRCGSSTSPARAAARPGPPRWRPGIHVLENRALGEPSAKVDLVRAALGEPRDARRHRRRLPRRCWPTTASPRTTSAPTPPTACTSTRSAPGPRAWSGWGPTVPCPACGWRRAHRAPRPTRTSPRCGSGPTPA